MPLNVVKRVEDVATVAYTIASPDGADRLNVFGVLAGLPNFSNFSRNL